ncbi:MAG: hypothetical protein O7E57_16745 [Gammaproteobacteria bacterium]|nr:hypothetical protein [Gammaproteobacteria bacterium]
MKSLLREKLNNLIGNALFRPVLATLIVFSTLLSVGSFYTSFQGMQHFVPSVIFCAAFVAGFQFLLLVTSFYIFRPTGFSPLNRFGIGLVLVTCLGLSVFFSFSEFNDEVVSEQYTNRINITSSQSIVEGILATAGERLDDAYDSAIENLLARDAYQEWRSTVFQVSDLVAGNDEELTTQVRNRIRASQQSASARIAEIEAAGERINTLDRNIARVQGQIEQTVQRRADIEAELPVAQTRLADFETQTLDKKNAADTEESAGDPSQNRIEGPGPVWRGLMNEYRFLVGERDGAKRVVEKHQADIEEQNGIIAQHESDIADWRAEKTSAQTLSDAAPPINVPAEQFDADAVRKEMTDNLNTFSNDPDLARLNIATERCRSLVEYARLIPSLANQMSGLDCANRESFAANLSEIRTLAANQTTFGTLCGARGANGINGTNVRAIEVVSEVIQHGANCVDATGLPGAQVSDLRNRLDQAGIEYSGTAPKFVTTFNALSSGEKQSSIALVLATTLDLLIIFCAFVGMLTIRTALTTDTLEHGHLEGLIEELSNMSFVREASDNAQRAALKTLILVIRTNPDNKEFPLQINLDDIPDEHHDQIHLRLTALSLKQIVRQEQNRFLIKEQAYASLIEEVQRTGLRPIEREQATEEISATEHLLAGNSGEFSEIRLDSDFSVGQSRATTSHEPASIPDSASNDDSNALEDDIARARDRNR